MSGAEPFLIAAAVAKAAGSVVQGVNAYQMGQYQSKALLEQANQARREAASASQIALEQGDRTMGTGITIAAKNGGVEGSSLDVLGDLGRQSMYEARRSAMEGAAEGRGLTSEAHSRSQHGKIALLTSAFDAGSTILSAGMDRNERQRQAGFMRTQQRASGSGTRSRVSGSLGSLYDG